MNNSIKNQYPFDKNKFKKYFIVKIAGKGNIPKKDIRNINLFKNIPNSLKRIKELIRQHNLKNKKVLIMWDGDNYQGQKLEKPSPFTDLILELSKQGFSISAVKFRNNKLRPWKQKHLDSWGDIKFIKYFSETEPHILINDICDIYISYGSTKFKFKEDKISKGETAGYAQLKEFRKTYKLNNLYKNKDLGFEIYIKK